MSDNKIVKTKTIEEVKEIILQAGTGFDAKHVLRKVGDELKDIKNKVVGPETFLYKAMTVYEFDKGVLLASSLPERFRVFALEFNKNLQNEYKCATPSEKSIAEMVTLNYVRVLTIQDRINSYLSIGSITDMGVRYLGVLSKELDRAERHYLTSLQALKMLKIPPLGVNIRTQMAVVGQNQIVQAKNQNDKAI